MADKRKGYKHGDFIEDRQTAKKQQAGLGQLAKRKSKNIYPTIIKLDVGKDGKNIFKVVESKAKGGRAGLKGGGRAYGKNS